jgi:hypothetical protein
LFHSFATGLAFYMYKKGGAGGLNTKGGPGDIFKVGKSNAKKFNKVTPYRIALFVDAFHANRLPNIS